MADRDKMLKKISHSAATLTRRGFVMATLAAGFALAVRPVSGETLTTDQTGLTAGEIQIRTSDGHIPAYRAKPEKVRRCRLCLSCRKSSESMNTSRTSVADWPSWVT